MKKLYDVTFRFDPKDYDGEVRAVGLRGEFLFYESGLTGNTDETGMMDCTEKFPPSAYREGLSNIGGIYYEPMEKNADGIYELTLKLPPEVYPYTFLVNPELGEPSEKMFFMNMTMKDGTVCGMKNPEDALAGRGEVNRMVLDPANPPVAPTVSGRQANSECYVGTPEECLRIPPADPAKRGTLTYLSYEDVDGAAQSIAVYLPAGYDRAKTYPLVLVSHGGGGNEADWPSQGSIANVMDNLIAQGRAREAVLVCMNNSVYSWDYAKIARNCEEKIIPFVEKLFSVSREVKDRAFCGLSMGSMTTLYMYMHRASVYDYFGAFSGGLAGGEHFTLEDPRLKDVVLMIGSGEEDMAYNEREIGVPPTIRALKAKGLPYIPYFVTGSHDWFCWPEMFAYFAEHVLWSR